MVEVGDVVEFKGEDSQYTGVVVSVFNKINGATRCIVEDERGLLLIKNPKSAKVLNKLNLSNLKQEQKPELDMRALVSFLVFGKVS